jgi:hypothetical protein
MQIQTENAVFREDMGVSGYNNTPQSVDALIGQKDNPQARALEAKQVVRINRGYV